MDEDELSTEMLIHRLGEERQRSTEIHLNSESPRTTPEKPVHDTPLVGSQIPTPQTQTPPQDQVQVANGQRSLRKKKSNGHHGNALDPVEEVMKPLTDEERRNWKGWVELESDPALFNYILRKYGVKDVRIQEIFSLDDLSLADLPMPVYGLIFLFKYRDDDAEEDEETPKCPKHVWFANQTVNNACATIALMNIVMNVPDIDLGDSLKAFKESTRRLKPPYRGQALGCNDFVRNIHNSFARRMDMLNADLALSNDFDKWQKSKKNPKKKNINKAPKKRKKDDEEAAFHFIAYVPIHRSVWRLDGLQRQPVNLGDFEDKWIALARDNIMQRIEQYADDGVEYNLIALCRSPLCTIQENLAVNIKSIKAAEERLNAMVPDWKAFTEYGESSSLDELQESFSLTRELIDKANPPESAIRRLEEAGSDPRMLIDMHQDLVKEQKNLQNSFMHEVSLIGQEEEQAARRREDNTPFIYHAIKALSEAGVLKDIIMDLKQNGEAWQNGPTLTQKGGR